ncbi:hypothetical protein BS78_01G174400 [Paspalum vaginatum]|nr:hypothetical protein BS78_01G174400 [Paspalum vaginatum]KAJ1294808.1 hypothetical protein BS78_01G174400 [Paspalum vaginatum]
MAPLGGVVASLALWLGIGAALPPLASPIFLAAPVRDGISALESPSDLAIVDPENILVEMVQVKSLGHVLHMLVLLAWGLFCLATILGDLVSDL